MLKIYIKFDLLNDSEYIDIKLRPVIMSYVNKLSLLETSVKKTETNVDEIRGHECKVVKNSFLNKECLQIIKNTKDHMKAMKEYRPSYRNNTRFIVNEREGGNEFAHLFWERVKDQIETVVFIDESSNTLYNSKSYHGIWIKSGLNP